RLGAEQLVPDADAHRPVDVHQRFALAALDELMRFGVPLKPVTEPRRQCHRTCRNSHQALTLSSRTFCTSAAAIRAASSRWSLRRRSTSSASRTALTDGFPLTSTSTATDST